MKIVDWLLIQMLKQSRLEMIALDFIRHNLSRRAVLESGKHVLFGLFKGLEMNERSGWDEVGSTATKILGLYESEILQELEKMDVFDTLINVGAADGYYAFGLLHAKKCRNVIAFESDPASRHQIFERSIRENAQIDLHGQANSSRFLNAIQDLDMSKAVVILDIEGEEFELLDDEKVIESLSRSTIIIEIHDFLMPEYDKGVLENKLSKYFLIRKLKNNKRILPEFEFLEKLHDNHKWLLVSEGRIQGMEWWILTPQLRKGTP